MRHPSSSTRPPLVFIPTYNERDNAQRLLTSLLELPQKLDILFLDDNSPDGTGELLDQLATVHPNVYVIHRRSKLGIGSAHYDGISWAYEHQYATLITMDCDFTHRPECINVALQMPEVVDCVIGSRYMKTNSLPGWNLLRRTLTYSGHLMTRIVLGMKYDATGAFRLYRLDRIPRGAFQLVNSKGYSFFFESLYVLVVNGYTIGEFPISLPARTYGHSKMDLREALKSVKLLLSIFLVSKFNPEKYQLDEPLPLELVDSTKQDTQGWEDYWANSKPAGRHLYDAVATCYRKLIIKPSLTYFVKKYFASGAEVLHAGCGSGQVDTSIRDYISITGLDISVNALRFYRKTNRNFCRLLHGSILDIPLPDGSIDGIYNLGVMEHFTPPEIQQILTEFFRVLKPGGRIVLFWPPEFGVSVLFFKALKWFSATVLRKPDVKFHPDEISRVQSKAQVQRMITDAKFSLLEYYFGPKDCFTQAVVVAEKPYEAEKAAKFTQPLAVLGL